MTVRTSIFLAICIAIANGCDSDSNKAASSPAPADSTTEQGPPQVTMEDDDQVNTSEEQTAVTPTTLTELDERLAEMKGNIVVMDIWSTSCVPCMKEFHHLVALSQKHTEGVRCVSLNVDYIGLPKRKPESYLADVQAFVEKEKAYKVVNLLSADADAEVLEKYGVEAMPAIIVFDRDGIIVAKLTDANASGEGLSYEADVLPLVSKMLSPTP